MPRGPLTSATTIVPWTSSTFQQLNNFFKKFIVKDSMCPPSGIFPKKDLEDSLILPVYFYFSLQINK
jgi:hypothetical protein